MKDNLYSWFSGFALSSLSMINGWVQVENAVEIAVYGFIGGVVGMLGKWLVQHISSKFQKYFSDKQ